MENSQFDYMVSGRVSDIASAIGGSIKVTCVECGEEVWASPASQRVLEQGTKPICLQCASLKGYRPPHNFLELLEHVSPAQAQEILGELCSRRKAAQ